MKVIKRQEEKSQKAAEYFAPTVNSFQNLWENLPVACHILTPEGIITHVNQTEARMLGYKKEEMVGKSIFDFVLPEQRLVAKKRFQQKLAGRRLPRARDRIYVRKDGSKINLIINDRIKWDSQKKPICVFGTLVNITNYKKVEDLNQEMMKNMRNWSKTVAGFTIQRWLRPACSSSGKNTLPLRNKKTTTEVLNRLPQCLKSGLASTRSISFWNKIFFQEL